MPAHQGRSIVRLILLNGPPASGKSALAARFVAAHPLTLNLDIDVVRGLLGGWMDQPTEAGLLAREIASAMAVTTLAGGHDVIVPQFLGRPDFIIRLETLAMRSGAVFVEIALIATRDEVRTRFASRSHQPDTATHEHARLLLDRLGGDGALDRMYDDFVALVASRPATRRDPGQEWRRGPHAPSARTSARRRRDPARRALTPPPSRRGLLSPRMRRRRRRRCRRRPCC